MKYSIEHIAQVIEAEAMIRSHADIKLLLTDSRSLFEPSESLFFALITRHNDGHKFIEQLYNKGVRSFVVQHLPENKETMPEANFLLVNDSLLALQQLASFHRKQFNIPVIGITGSNGKTIVKEWLYQLLHKDFNIVRSPRSYNSQIGVPLSVWQLNEETNLGIFEAGISLPGEMVRLEPVIQPGIGLFTNIGDAHQENFTSLEEKCREKLELFRHTEIIIYHSDNLMLDLCIRERYPEKKRFTWSFSDNQADLFVTRVQKSGDGTEISYNHAGKSQNLRIPFTDAASVENAILCLATTLFMNPELRNPKERFGCLESVAMRLNVKKGIHNNIIINDTYNSDINSLAIALDFMSRRSLDNKLAPVLILSDILQSGTEANIFYKKVSELLEQKQVRRLIGIGPELMKHTHLFSLEKAFFHSTEEFLNSGILNQFSDSILLIKGSRSFQFERITEQLEEKVHQTVLEVDLDAIVHNFKYFRGKLKPETRIICMVKAFGYGVGSYELAKTLQDQGCDYLAVAVADEGSELRQEGITMPIMVMNPEMHAFSTLFDYNLEPEVYSFGILNALIKEAGRRGITNYPVHIKLNTGMNRLGFDPEDIRELAGVLKSQQAIKVRSVFSHLAASDAPEYDNFTRLQMQKFAALSSELESLLVYPLMKHLLNSAGMERFPDFQQNMVRLGIGLYGISVVDPQLLKPVATLKTRILQIRTVKKGETVGYNRSGIIAWDSRIACLPIGYADGLDRRLGNGNMSFLIDGKLCPTIGNICMDICMVDVTETNAEEGDEATIFGKEISISLLAEKLGTIPYEILTSISPRVKRVYFRE
ncbi:MAG: bifunctional UDP-N-acetylmuramoyl-tripeptide:D-alanyl-D-alanine ligase/alanine racemase [Dysgonamonadaceae bacterium]|jgi:alanine racemase|nr:bifunctional UDP-N-acetylmuramoyl-tripeptide:D-alanyl-D-alanine ligase/alanine racemase [Dysgonamonadaceae bacterium]